MWNIPRFAFVGFSFLFLGFAEFAPAQSPWQSFPGSRLVEEDFFDGDSFKIELQRNGQTEAHVVRLYFVDAPETSAETDSDRKRVLEQARYFGITPPPLVLEHGAAAREKVRELLGEPFTVHTAFASAPGRSKLPRIYALVQTASGKDLGELLVEAGLARTHGVGRALPDGTPASAVDQRLVDLEATAMLARRGLWADADAETLANLRAAEREEVNALRAAFGGDQSEPVNLNTATLDELQTLPGVGAILAQRLMEARPFKSLQEVESVRGFSANMIERWEGGVTLEDSPNP
jgi:competence protein ComEA